MLVLVTTVPVAQRWISGRPTSLPQHSQYTHAPRLATTDARALIVVTTKRGKDTKEFVIRMDVTSTPTEWVTRTSTDPDQPSKLIPPSLSKSSLSLSPLMEPITETLRKSRDSSSKMVRQSLTPTPTSQDSDNTTLSPMNHVTPKSQYSVRTTTSRELEE